MKQVYIFDMKNELIKVGVYHSDFLQLVRRYCPTAEVFYDLPYWSLRYVGKR